MVKDRIGTRIKKTKKRINNLMYSRARAALEGLEVVAVPGLTAAEDKPVG